MVALRQVEVTFYKGNGRQNGRGFNARGQVIGRTALHILGKCIASAAKHVDADLLKFVVPEVAGVFSGRKFSRQLQRG